MNISATITKQVAKIPSGIIFSSRDFFSNPNSMGAVSAMFSRLASKGIIKRFSKGKYFKPTEGMFGEIPLKENEILNSILRENGKITGYLTGNVAYNVMGLTTQISNEYIIATYGFRKPLQKGRIKARFVRAYANIEENNIPLLQLLDSIKDIKSIPGVETNTALELIKIKLQALSLNEVKLLTQIALNYPPATRALTGALLELLKFDTLSKKLFNSLNFLSKYKFSINEKILPNKNKWKIE